MSYLPSCQPSLTAALNNLCHADNPLLMAFPKMALAGVDPGLEEGIAGYQAQARGPAIRSPLLLKLPGFLAKPLAERQTISRVEAGAEAKGTKDCPPTGQGKLAFGTGAKVAPFAKDVYDALRDFAQNGLSPEEQKFENQANKKIGGR